MQLNQACEHLAQLGGRDIVKAAETTPIFERGDTVRPQFEYKRIEG